MDAAHLPAFDINATAATYDLYHGQWLLDHDGHTARYPFGYGMSYANGELGDITVVREGDEVVVTATLSNRDGRSATEVVQVYAGHRGEGVERPEWRLAGFARVEAPAKGASAFRLAIPIARLAVRIDGEWRAEPGEYEFAVGLRAHDPKAVATRIEIG
jgi:beta-glucosidase